MYTCNVFAQAGIYVNSTCSHICGKAKSVEEEDEATAVCMHVCMYDTLIISYVLYLTTGAACIHIPIHACIQEGEEILWMFPKTINVDTKLIVLIHEVRWHSLYMHVCIHTQIHARIQRYMHAYTMHACIQGGQEILWTFPDTNIVDT